MAELDLKSIVAFSMMNVVGYYVIAKLQKTQHHRQSVHVDDCQGRQQYSNKDNNLPYPSGHQELTIKDDKSGTLAEDHTLHAPYYHERLSIDDILERSSIYLRFMEQRRSIRFFASSRNKVNIPPREVMENIIKAACTAPSGAHKQPWHFCLVGNIEKKQQIRKWVEEEETINYQRRMRSSWVNDVSYLVSNVGQTKLGNNSSSGSSNNNHRDGNDGVGVDKQQPELDDDTAKKVVIIDKPYLTDAPWLIIVMKQPHGGIDPMTKKRTIDHYYVSESVGIACGILISAIHNANLVTLPSTPMGAEKNIKQLLQRPEYEKVMLLLPVGYPSNIATVPYRNPNKQRKPTSDVVSIF